jgi:hypothetical protein
MPGSMPCNKESVMRTLNFLIWRNWSAHGPRSVLTTLAITPGVAMVLDASIARQAASTSATQLSQTGSCIDLHPVSREDTPLQGTILDTLLDYDESLDPVVDMIARGNCCSMACCCCL